MCKCDNIVLRRISGGNPTNTLCSSGFKCYSCLLIEHRPFIDNQIKLSSIGLHRRFPNTHTYSFNRLERELRQAASNAVLHHTHSILTNREDDCILEERIKDAIDKMFLIFLQRRSVLYSTFAHKAVRQIVDQHFYWESSAADAPLTTLLETACEKCQHLDVQGREQLLEPYPPHNFVGRICEKILGLIDSTHICDEESFTTIEKVAKRIACDSMHDWLNASPEFKDAALDAIWSNSYKELQ